jgi:dUTP pyrophosphatase
MENIFKDFYLNVELVNKYAKLPIRGTEESGGLDFFSPIDFSIPPEKDFLLPLGLKVEFPKGFALIMKEKSGIATKKKISILANLIDSDYRGIVHAHLHNTSPTEVAIFSEGDKVCQGIVVPLWIGLPEQVDHISEDTERGTGGFGSTDKR